MRIAVHMLTYPREHYGYTFTTFALATLMLQTHRDWTLYLIDDVGTSFALSTALAELKAKGIEVHNEDRIKVLPFGDSTQLSVIPDKRRHAIEQTSEELAVVFDDDDYRSPHFLAAINAAYEKNSAIRYNFRSSQLTYDLSKSIYWRPSLHVGSGSWSFRLAWYRSARVALAGRTGQRHASDKLFLEDLRRAGEVLVLKKHVPAIDLMVIAFWHKSNCIPRGRERPLSDPQNAWLYANIDARLHGLMGDLLTLCERAGPPLQVRRRTPFHRSLIVSCRRLARRCLDEVAIRWVTARQRQA